MEIAPNSAYLGLAAGIALRLRRPRLAIEFLRQGDPENWWRAPFLYWDQMAHAYHMLGDHRQQLEEVRRGQSQQTNPVFIRWQEINALAALGRTEQIEALFQESYWPRLGQSMANLAAELSAHGYGGAATEMLHRAVEWFEDRSPEQKRGLRDRRALVLCSQSLFRFADLGDDGLCRGGPDKGCGVIVSAIDVVVDRLD